MAAGKMANERAGHTLQATALVNEAYLRLIGNDQSWENRRHFYGAASEAMRRILIENARRKQAEKRGSGVADTEFRESVHDLPVDDGKLLEVHEVLDELQAENPKLAEVVKLRFFVGLTVPEIAELHEVSERTITRQWDLAKVWLVRALRKNPN
jgi:RNA polymerase sigma factor (TIGR02999 family)